jgi:hypothetical protein
VLLVFQGWDGLPTNVGHYFSGINYYRDAGYVGVVALVLAAAALVRCWKKPEVVSLVTLGFACFAILYFGPVARFVDLLPAVATVHWDRALIPLDFVLAVLAGRGLHEVLQSLGENKSALRLLAWIWGAAACVLALLFAYYLHVRGALPPGGSHERLWSFAWPWAQVSTGLIVTWYLLWRGHASPRGGRARTAGMVLLLVETGFLLWAGTPLWSSARQPFASTPGESRLQSLVGASRVGFANCPAINQFPSLGILPEANIAYRVSEFGFYDAIAPRGYYEEWSRITGQHIPVPPTGVFCPSITTAAEARLFGVQYILEPIGVAGPRGTTFTVAFDGEGLYRVPDSSLASIARPGQADDQALVVTELNSTTWKVVLHTPRSSVVHLRFSNFPGWHATIDGSAVPLTSWSGFMQQARVPAGDHVLILQYKPGAFTLGLVVALITLLLLLAWAFWESNLPRARRYQVIAK